ncbi:MAG: hypothetical protein V1913_11325 [Fibrobacterota bacterium]
MKLEKWREIDNLPRFLADLYDVFTTVFLERKHLFILCKNEDENTPASIQKHVGIIRDKWQGEVVFVCGTISHHNRKRLIEYKVPFVIPGNQLYLPDLGVALREHFRQIRKEKHLLSPSAQVVLLHAIINNDYGPNSSIQLITKLHYSPMTIARAIDEIEVSGLGVVESKGREKGLKFDLRNKGLWEKALPVLRSPVKRIVFLHLLNKVPAYPKAGLTALAERTMLAEPNNPVYAISAEEWKSLNSKKRIESAPHAEPGAVSFEIWRYAPAILGNNKLVDPLSLYLSIMHEEDERVVGEAESMLEDFFDKRT